MKIEILFLLTLSLCFFVATTRKQLDKKKVVFAMNIGSTEAYKGEDDFIYQADSGFPSSVVTDMSQDSALDIEYTNDDFVYKSERHFDGPFFYYDISLQDDNTYVLILKFAETYFSKQGQRIFNIRIGERNVSPNFDIFAVVGKNSAYDLYFQLTIQDKKVYYNDEECENAIVGRNKLRITFEKGKKDLPQVSGIVLYKGLLEETNYYEQEELTKQLKQSQLEAQQIEEYKNKQKLKKQQELLKHTGKKALDPSYFKVNDENIFQGIFRIFNQIEGLIISLIFFSLILLLQFVKEGNSSTEKKLKNE